MRALPPLPSDGIYRTILLVMVATILGGAILTLAGAYYFHDEAVSRLGTGIVLIGGLIYLIFRLLGRREAKRRAEREQSSGDWSDSDRDR